MRRIGNLSSVANVADADAGRLTVRLSTAELISSHRHLFAPLRSLVYHPLE